MEFNKAVVLLKEYYYEKNGKDNTIYFLKYILKELENADQDDKD